MRKRFMRLFGTGTVLVLGMAGNVLAAPVPDFTSESIRNLVLVREGEEIFEISYEPEEYKMSFDCWEILNPYDENCTVNTEAMYGLFEVVADLADFSPAEMENGTDTGFDKQCDAIKIQYVSGQEKAAQSVTKPDCAVTILIGNETEDGNRYVRVQGGDPVYLWPADTLREILDVDPFDYILKIPVLVNIEYLERVEIFVDGETYLMEKDSDIYYMNGEMAEKETFTSLYQSLMGVFLDSECPISPNREKEEVLRVVFHRTAENVKTTEVVYYSWDAEGYYTVAVDGKEQFLVKAEEVDALIEQIKDLF